MSNCPSGPLEILNDNQALVPSSDGIWAGKFGVLVAPGNKQALIAGINRLQSDSERARLGRLARQRAEDFSLEKINAQYWGVFLG